MQPKALPVHRSASLLVTFVVAPNTFDSYREHWMLEQWDSLRCAFIHSFTSHDAD
jgi:hypothetical protein